MSQRGRAIALASAAIHAVTQKPLRLHWCVDLDAEGLTYDPGNPTDDSGAWGELLARLRAALEAQTPWTAEDRWGDSKCKIAMTVNSTLRSAAHGNKRVQATFHLGWRVNLPLLVGRPPPVGRWVMAPEPPVANEFTGWLQGDQLPSGEAWTDYIPF